MAPLPEALHNWFAKQCPWAAQNLQAEPIPQDGSPRRFWRIKGHNLILMHSPHNFQENLAWLNIGRHLLAAGLPTPNVLACLPQAGMFAMEDLGELSVQQAVTNADGDHASLASIYQPIMDMLAKLQGTAETGFDLSWCFDGPRLDEAFLRQREMGYFHQQVVRRYQLPETPALPAELDLIAKHAAGAQPWGITHRDMQSRNLVLSRHGALGLVDFQGARLGPAQYDLVSLLNDPYVNLPLALREKMLRYYLRRLRNYRDFDEEQFMTDLPWVALSRNLQALAAYALLSGEKNKPHFKRYMQPAAVNLANLLACGALQKKLPALHTIAQALLTQTRKTLPH